MNDSHGPRWSLITVTYNSSAKLRTFWGQFSPPADVEWIVVDNASRDDSVVVATALGARVIELSENVGFGRANNIGFEASGGAHVAFVNPDVTPSLDDLPKLEEVLREEPTALVAPQLVYPGGDLQPNGRGEPYLAHKVLNRLVPKRLAGVYLKFAGPGERMAVSWLIGAVVAGRRGRLQQLGPWDPTFFVYYEDSDLGLRNLRTNGRNIVVGDARWVHGWARETASVSLAAWKLELQSGSKFFARYPRYLGVGARSLTRAARSG